MEEHANHAPRRTPITVIAPGHEAHAGHDRHAGHSVAMFRDKF